MQGSSAVCFEGIVWSDDKVTKVVSIGSLEEYRQLFVTDLNVEQRASLQTWITNTSNAPEATDDTARIARIQGYLHDQQATLHPGDAEFVAPFFPFDLEMTTATSATVTGPQTFGPSGSGFYYKLNTLTFAGGYAKFVGSSVTVTAENVVIAEAGAIDIIDGNPTSYHIGIFGVDGFAGKQGPAGVSGQNGTYGEGGQGYASPGGPGSPGGAGSPGGPAGLGSTTGIANIKFSSITLSSNCTLGIVVKQGNGGPGGMGGSGGTGGNGGNGGNAFASGCSNLSDGGSGGAGGNGGIGGNGSKGGDAVSPTTSLITLIVPIPTTGVPVFNVTSIAGKGGLGGAAGIGGQGGNGGGGGNGTKNRSNGFSGNSGADGGLGVFGEAGKDGVAAVVTPIYQSSPST